MYCSGFQFSSELHIEIITAKTRRFAVQKCVRRLNCAKNGCYMPSTLRWGKQEVLAKRCNWSLFDLRKGLIGLFQEDMCFFDFPCYAAILEYNNYSYFLGKRMSFSLNSGFWTVLFLNRQFMCQMYCLCRQEVKDAVVVLGFTVYYGEWSLYHLNSLRFYIYMMVRMTFVLIKICAPSDDCLGPAERICMPFNALWLLLLVICKASRCGETLRRLPVQQQILCHMENPRHTFH